MGPITHQAALLDGCTAHYPAQHALAWTLVLQTDVSHVHGLIMTAGSASADHCASFTNNI